MALKPVEDVIACVVDPGTFIPIAETLAKTMKKVYYHSPYDKEYLDIRDCIQGTGLDGVERLDEFLDPDVLDDIDLFVFPDIGYSGLQRHLRKLGKAVWGHMGGTDLELYRSQFFEMLEKLDLPVIDSVILTGLTALTEYLKTHEDRWVKIDRYRANMETWHHIDFAHSERTLDSLAVIFGGAKDSVTFVVQNQLPSEIEVGYDGFCIDGQFPSRSFQGYEKKNELYLGSVLTDKDLPDEIQIINKAMSPILAHFGYRNWWATEIRVVNGQPYFIDPTARMPGQTGEHQLESCTNLADLIWHGANGILLEPEFEWEFAAEATLHLDSNTRDDAIDAEWKTLDIPKAVRRWVKLYHFCKIGDLYHFPSSQSDEVGVVLGFGDSVQASIDHLMKNLKLLKDVPVHAEVSGFASLLDSIKEAEKQGVKFGGKVPTPESIVKKNVELL